VSDPAANHQKYPWKQIPEDVFALACQTLNQISAPGS